MESDSKSHSKLIKSAKKLFWKYGIHKVTVEEICSEAGISKMTFYRNFKNKNEVAEKVIDNFTQSYMSKYKSIMNDEEPFKFKAQKLVALEHETVIGISQEFIKDIYQKDDSELVNKLEKFRKNVINDMMFEFKQAQEKGEIRKDLNLDFMLYMLNDINDKILDEKLNKMFPKKEDLVMQLTNFFFYGILP
ncbi:MAG: TetR/AcrR family transcriptional regulator [Flavobacteriaceae bacterium]|nr:TetR/AcrR family transcriptional regulator [Flavobacteriaceae bacterium]